MMNATRQNLLEAIDVWSIRLPDLPDEVERCRSLLSGDELERAAAFIKPKDAESFILCRGMLRRILGDVLNADPTTLSFQCNPNGKPYLPGGELDFNVSHSRDRLLIAVTSGRAVGVDIEFRRNNVNMNAIAERYFTPEECAFFQGSENPKQTFFDIWAEKEAYVKAHGQGIFNLPAAFAVPSACRANVPMVGTNGEWFFQTLEIDAAYSAAVVSEAPAVPVTLRTLA